MTIQLTFHIELQSDYHVSAGHGWGAALDSALQRDADGIPVLRGTTVTGLLRDGLHQLAAVPVVQASALWQKCWTRIRRLAADGEELPLDIGRDPKPADILFGAPWTPKRWRISSARPVGLETPQQNADKSGWQIGGVGAKAAVHVRVDPALRRAEARKLFQREEGDQRLGFTFTATCDHADAEAEAEATLLVAAARMVQHLGAGRRRGRGQCDLTLNEVQGWPISKDETTPAQDLLLDRFEALWLKGASATAKTVERPLLEATRTGHALRVKVLLRLEEPVIISRRAAAGNQFETLDFIPGFALRGALAGRIANRYDLDERDSQAYQRFVELFFRDSVSFSPFYPAWHLPTGSAEYLYPAIPAPLDLFVSELHSNSGKVQQTHFPSLTARQTAAKDFRETSDGADLKLEPLSGYLALADDTRIINPGRSSEMHVTLHEETGRAKDQELFGYVVLEAGQYFVGEIDCVDQADWETLRGMADLPGLSQPFTLRMGKAHRRGYGKVRCAFLTSTQEPTSIWEGLPLESRVVSSTEPFVLTLLSDTILVDSWGRSYQSFEGNWLEKVLGFPVQIATEVGASGIKHQLHFARGRIIDSFNNHVGLPRQRDIALAAGSAVTLQPAEGMTLVDLRERLSAIERTGIGLRRNEGFGRLIFNHPVYQNACADMEIRVPDGLTAAKDAAETLWSSERLADRKWTDILEQYEPEWEKLRKLPKEKREQFGGLVREIGTSTLPSLESARNLLASYGKVENLLPEGLPGRQKPNFFEEGQLGYPGRQLLQTLFEQLDGHAAGSPTVWANGCRMLANKLGDVITSKEK